MAWQDYARSAIGALENFGLYVEKGLTTIRDAKLTATLVKEVPELAPVVAKLSGAIPFVGQAQAVLSLADFAVEHWGAIAALGAVTHFAPADVLTYEPWKDSSDPAARQE